MNKTRFLKIQFDKNFQAFDIPKLRAAIIEKTNRISDLFHNHLGDSKFLYRYPLIQYKILNKKPNIVCLAQATDDIHYLLKEKEYNFSINGKNYDFEIEDVRLKYVNIQTWDAEFKYNIHNYMALNQDNYKLYQDMDSLVERIGFLENLLNKHISLFAEELNAHLPFPIVTKIVSVNSEKYIEYKNNFHLTFSINFKTNLFIPNYIGLGKGTSVGFGIVKKLSNYEKRIPKKERNSTGSFNA